MRFRKKHFAIPEMSESALVFMDKEDFTEQWGHTFPLPNLPLHVELGCGKGRFLAEAAAAHPTVNFLGIDVEPNAMITAKRYLEEKELQNARLLLQDIGEMEDLIPADSVDQLYIHFPNPWPKRRHYKRRLTHPRQLIHYHSFLKEGAKIWFKTDDEDLYRASLEYFSQFGFDFAFTTEDLDPAQDPSCLITEYEEKWRGRGIEIKAIEAVKKSVSPEELQQQLEIFSEKEKSERVGPRSSR